MNEQKGKEINELLKNFSIVFSGAIIEMKDGTTQKVDNAKLERFIEKNTWTPEGAI